MVALSVTLCLFICEKELSKKEYFREEKRICTGKSTELAARKPSVR